MKPHGRDCPDRCSICIGAAARKVELVDGAVVIDGEQTGRPAEVEPLTTQPRRRRAKP